MAAKFNKGDKVKILSDRNEELIDTIGVVDKILGDNWNVDHFNWKYCLLGVVKYGWYREDQLELVTKNTNNES